MANTWYAFFDSTPDDPRLILAEDWAKYNRSLFTDGIRNGGDCFLVKPSSGLSVDVKAGLAVIQGYIFRVDEDAAGDVINVRLPSANPYDARTDRIVLRFDRRIERRQITVTYKMGAAGGSAPELERDANIWELSLARVNIAANQTGILAADITDERFDADLCGLINTLLRLDTTSWQELVDETINAEIAKFDGAFADWTNRLNGEYASHSASLAAMRNDFQTWFESVKLDLALTVTFDLDNTASRPQTNVVTTIGDGSIATAVTNSATGKVIAERTVNFNGDGTITTNERVYGETSTLRDVTITTSFDADGVTEIVI